MAAATEVHSTDDGQLIPTESLANSELLPPQTVPITDTYAFRRARSYIAVNDSESVVYALFIAPFEKVTNVREITGQVAGIIGSAESHYPGYNQSPGKEITFPQILQLVDVLRKNRKEEHKDQPEPIGLRQRLASILPILRSKPVNQSEEANSVNNHMNEIPTSGLLYRFTSVGSGEGMTAQLTLLNRDSDEYRSLVNDPNQSFLSFTK